MARLATILVAASVTVAVPLAARAQGAPPQPEPVGAQVAPWPALWRVSLASGVGHVAEIADAIAGDLPFTLTGYETTNTDRLELVLRLDREVGRFGRVGVSYAYDTWTKHARGGLGDSTADLKNRVQALLAHGFLRWIDGRWVELYSGAGVGVATWEQWGNLFGSSRSRTKGLFAWQLHAIGLGVGNAWVRGFVELGFGFEGVAEAGLAARF